MRWRRSARAAGESAGRVERGSARSVIGRLSSKRTDIAPNATSDNNFHTLIGERPSVGGPRSAANCAHNRPGGGGAPAWRRRAADDGRRPRRTGGSAQRTGSFILGSREFLRRSREFLRENSDCRDACIVPRRGRLSWRRSSLERSKGNNTNTHVSP